MLVEFKFHGPVVARVTGRGEASVVIDVPGPGGRTAVATITALAIPAEHYNPDHPYVRARQTRRLRVGVRGGLSLGRREP